MFDEHYRLLDAFAQVLQTITDHNSISHFTHELTTAMPTKPIHPRSDLPVLNLLPTLLETITNDALTPLRKTVSDVSNKLIWNAFYQKNALTESFIDRFAVAEVMGPDGPIVNDNAILYLFIIGANTLYPLHWHVANELYFILSGEPSYRVGEINWHKRHPGDLIVVPSCVPHSIHVEAKPMLALQMWQGNVHQGSIFPVSKDGTPAEIIRAEVEGSSQSLK